MYGLPKTTKHPRTCPFIFLTLPLTLIILNIQISIIVFFSFFLFWLTHNITFLSTPKKAVTVALQLLPQPNQNQAPIIVGQDKQINPQFLIIKTKIEEEITSISTEKWYLQYLAKHPEARNQLQFLYRKIFSTRVSVSMNNTISHNPVVKCHSVRRHSWVYRRCRGVLRR